MSLAMASFGSSPANSLIKRRVSLSFYFSSFFMPEAQQPYCKSEATYIKRADDDINGREKAEQESLLSHSTTTDLLICGPNFMLVNYIRLGLSHCRVSFQYVQLNVILTNLKSMNQENNADSRCVMQTKCHIFSYYQYSVILPIFLCHLQCSFFSYQYSGCLFSISFASFSST